MTIKAIETEYNGYKFRSRLEARWAVFFDVMGIDYKYEDEGYEYWETEDGNYKYKWLPDFVLTSENNLLVEVKGGDEALSEDWERLAMAVDFCDTPASEGLLILGDLPNPNNVGLGSIPIFSYLYWHKGVVCEFAAFIEPRNKYFHNQSKIVRESNNITDAVFCIGFENPPIEDYVSGWCEKPTCVTTKERILKDAAVYSRRFEKLKKAYTIARQARFEHGEIPRVKSVFDDD